MGFALEDGEVRLAHDRGVVIIHLAEQQVTAHIRVRILCEEVIHDKHLAKGRSGLRQRQACVLGQCGVILSQHRMDRVAELMGERGDIVHPPLVGCEHPGQQIGLNRGTKRAAALAAPDL